MSTTWLAGLLNHQQLVTKNCTKGKTPPTSKFSWTLPAVAASSNSSANSCAKLMTSPTHPWWLWKLQPGWDPKWRLFSCLAFPNSPENVSIFISSSFVGDSLASGGETKFRNYNITRNFQCFPKLFWNAFPSFLIFPEDKNLAKWNNISPT